MSEDKSNFGRGKRRQATIVDVADAAGVAIGTVSRYLNGHPIRRGNRDRIEQAIERLGYQRNAVAAAMKTDLTNTVGFMVPALSEFHSAVLEKLSRNLRRAGKALLSYCHDADPQSAAAGLDFFAAHRVDCLVMDGQEDVGDRIKTLLDHGTPVVFYDNDIRGLPVDRVFVENRAASRRAVEHLLDLGHERVAVLAGDLHNFAGRERLEGYRQALAGRGVPINPDYVIDAHWQYDGGYSGMRALLELPEPPTAVYSCNYNMTHGALAVLKEHRLKLPDDLSLVSFDDVPLFSLHEVGITAVSQPLDKIADTIAGILLQRLSNRMSYAPHTTTTLPCDIILRGSTRRLLTPAALGANGR